MTWLALTSSMLYSETEVARESAFLDFFDLNGFKNPKDFFLEPASAIVATDEYLVCRLLTGNPSQALYQVRWYYEGASPGYMLQDVASELEAQQCYTIENSGDIRVRQCANVKRRCSRR